MDKQRIHEQAFREAALAGDVWKVRQMLTKVELLDCVDEYGNTALQWASGTGQNKVVQLLLTAMANVDACNVRGETALHIAAEFGHEECIALLLDRVSLVDQVDRRGRTAMAHAIHMGHQGAVSALARAGARFESVRLGSVNSQAFAPSQRSLVWKRHQSCVKATLALYGILRMRPISCTHVPFDMVQSVTKYVLASWMDDRWDLAMDDDDNDGGGGGGGGGGAGNQFDASPRVLTDNNNNNNKCVLQ